MNRFLCVLVMLFCACVVSGPAAAEDARWALAEDGSITWGAAEGAPLAPHRDHIEMSGRQVSLILRYGVDDAGALWLERHLVWPMLRTIPNNTHASLQQDFGAEASVAVRMGEGPAVAERPVLFRLRGLLTVVSRSDEGLEITRTIAPCTNQPAVVENIVIRNTSDAPRLVTPIQTPVEIRTDPAQGVYGEYVLTAQYAGPGAAELAPGASLAYAVVYAGRKASDPPLVIDAAAEETARRAYVDDLFAKLVFACPDPVLSRAFAFAKVRAAESIYATKGGLMHGPGGGAYYAAIWANDQAEYAGPFFPFLGDAGGDEASLNAYRHFARFMNPEYTPIPSSIIAEGADTWNGAGDRGDAAMVAYGAARFALARGDRAAAEELWPLITWCLEYCKRKITKDGVIASDSDELENRFPAGRANLCTASLAYDALLSAVSLGRDLGKPEAELADYGARADALRAAIESHFGWEMDGFPTYRYYRGNRKLRAWICIPLVMGIFDRREGTIAALFSPSLWTEDGLATQAGQETFWDRATLYGLRGVFYAGDTDRALRYFQAYSTRRLLGEHVPYPVEAWPEGNQRHLSAESALYCRVVTEGLFGIRPAGLRAFTCTPRLPQGWDTMALRNIRAFGQAFDLEVARESGGTRVIVKVGDMRIIDTAFDDAQPVAVQLPE